MLLIEEEPKDIFNIYSEDEEYLALYWRNELEEVEEDLEELEELEEDLEEIEELEEIYEEEDYFYRNPRNIPDYRLLCSIGARDYIETLVPSIEDRGKEISIDGWVLSKKTPQWKEVVLYLTTFICKGEDEKTKFILSHKDYETGEAWWNLGVKQGIFDLHPKEFNKGALKRFLKLLNRYENLTKKELEFFNRALTYKEFSLNQLKRLERLRYDHGECIVILEEMMKIPPHEREARLLDKERNKIPYDFYYEEADRVIKTPSSFLEIVKEGEKMGHCVGSYVPMVYKQLSIILFLRDKDNKRVATIEIDPMTYELMQLYGRSNELVSFHDYKIVENFINSIGGWVEYPEDWYE